MATEPPSGIYDIGLPATIGSTFVTHPYVIDLMAERLHMRYRRLANAFWGHDLPRCLAVVFADGTKHNQSAPYVQGEHGYWWPVLAVPHHYISTAMVVYCQAQALSDSRPYETHPSRVHFMQTPPWAVQSPPPPPQDPWFVHHTTVTIEEVLPESEPSEYAKSEPATSEELSGREPSEYAGSESSWDDCGKPPIRRRWGKRNNE